MYNNPDELMMFLAGQGAPPRLPSIQQYMPVRASGPTFQQPTSPLNQPMRAMGGGIGGGMDPMKMALLAAGMRMLQSAGPSTQKTSLGQAIGAGGMEGLNVYNQQRHQQFQEQQLAENSELRREQIEGMRGMRQAQAGELASKAEERQRIQSLMPEYQAAVQSGNQEAVRSVISKMYPKEFAEASLKEPSERNPWSGITVADYTRESVGAYQRSIEAGKPDRSLLVADPNQTRAAGASKIDIKTGESFWKEFGKGQAETIIKQQDTAQQAADSVTVLHNMRRQLDGGAITGFGADLVLNFGRALSFAGFKSAEDPVANTQAFAAQAGNLVGQIIKQFGSGTGLSDADREYATKIAGGQITMDEKALRRLLDINEKANRVLITRYNNKVRGMKKKAPASEIPIELEIDEPPAYSRPAPTATNPQTGEKLEFRDGRWQSPR